MEGAHQTEGTRGKGQGSLHSPTALQVKFRGQKTTSAPPCQTGGRESRTGSSNNSIKANEETLVYITT